jgi:hypothetical protein
MSDTSSSRPVWLIAFLVLIALLAVGVQLGAPIALEYLLRASARVYGIESFDVRVRAIDWRQLELVELRVGARDDLQVASLALGYSLAGLRQGRLDSLVVSGLRAHAVWGEQGLDPGFLDGLLPEAPDPVVEPPGDAGDEAGDSGGGIPALPVARLALESAHLDLETPIGSLAVDLTLQLEDRELRGSGRLQSGDGGIELVLDLEPAPPGAGEPALRLAPYDVMGSLDLLIRDLELGETTAGLGLEGRLEFSTAGDRAELRAPRGLRIRGPLPLRIPPSSRSMPLLSLKALPGGDLSATGRVGFLAARPLELASRAEGRVDFALSGSSERLSGEAKLQLFAEELESGGLRLPRLELRSPLGLRFHAGQLDLDAEIAPTSLSGTWEGSGGAAVWFEGQTPRILFSAARDPLSQGLRGEWSCEGGVILLTDATAPEREVELAGLGLEGDWSLGEAGPSVRADFALESIQLGGEVPLVTPLSIAGELAYRDARAEVRAEMEGSDRALLVVGPGDLFPFLADLLIGGSGSVAASASLRWSGSDLHSELDLSLKELGFEAEGIRVEGIDGRLQYRHPPTGGEVEQQRIRFTRVVTGFEATDGVLAFTPTPDGAVRVDELSWRMFGGEVRGSGLLGSPHQEPQVAFRMEQIDLAALLEFLDLEGLRGEGRLGGVVPLVVEEGRARVRGGRLSSGEEGGRIHYAPPVLPALLQGAGPQVDLVVEVLKNFRFEQLSVGIDGAVEGDISFGFRFQGANPEVEKGRPVDLSLNLSVPVSSILKSLWAPLRVLDEIEQRVRDEMQIGL